MIIQSKSDFRNFHDKQFRPGQEETIQYIYNSPAKINVVTAPCGSGKSLIGMTLGNIYPKYLYLVSSKQLQSQLQHDFPEAEMMWGRSNYPCTMIKGRDASECFHTSDHPCPQKSTCPYEAQKRKTLASKRQILNYTYFLTESNYVGRFSNYPIIVCDEGDTIEDRLYDIVSLTFTRRMLERYGLDEPEYKTFGSVKAISYWKSWAKKSIYSLESQINELEDEMYENDSKSDTYLGLLKELNKLNTLKDKLIIMQSYCDEGWVLEYFKDKWTIKMSWLNKDLTDLYFFNHGEKFVFMSATFPHPVVLAETLGLNVGDINTDIELGSNFPVENRLVYLTYTADMKSMKGGGIDEKEVVKIQHKISSILNEHPEEKGIIHTVNWNLNKAVMDIGNPRLITHVSGENKADTLRRFYGSSNGVFVSPSSTRGLDLVDDLARFNIIAKCPYKNVADKLVSARLYGKRGLGELWYKSSAAQEIVQACGRGVRSVDDYCTTYILDRQACKLITDNTSLFPRYFIESVEVE